MFPMPGDSALVEQERLDRRFAPIQHTDEPLRVKSSESGSIPTSAAHGSSGSHADASCRTGGTSAKHSREPSVNRMTTWVYGSSSPASGGWTISRPVIRRWTVSDRPEPARRRRTCLAGRPPRSRGRRPAIRRKDARRRATAIFGEQHVGAARSSCRRPRSRGRARSSRLRGARAPLSRTGRGANLVAAANRARGGGRANRRTGRPDRARAACVAHPGRSAPRRRAALREDAALRRPRPAP